MRGSDSDLYSTIMSSSALNARVGFSALCGTTEDFCNTLVVHQCGDFFSGLIVQNTISIIHVGCIYPCYYETYSHSLCANCELHLKFYLLHTFVLNMTMEYDWNMIIFIRRYFSFISIYYDKNNIKYKIYHITPFQTKLNEP